MVPQLMFKEREGLAKIKHDSPKFTYFLIAFMILWGEGSGRVVHGGEWTALRSSLSFSAFTWVPGITMPRVFTH